MNPWFKRSSNLRLKSAKVSADTDLIRATKPKDKKTHWQHSKFGKYLKGIQLKRIRVAAFLTTAIKDRNTTSKLKRITVESIEPRLNPAKVSVSWRAPRPAAFVLVVNIDADNKGLVKIPTTDSHLARSHSLKRRRKQYFAPSWYCSAYSINSRLAKNTSRKWFIVGVHTCKTTAQDILYRRKESINFKTRPPEELQELHSKDFRKNWKLMHTFWRNKYYSSIVSRSQTLI